MLISELKTSLPCSQHKGYSRKAGLKYQIIVKGKGHSPNLLSKVEKLDFLDRDDRSSHGYIMEENVLKWILAPILPSL